MTNILLAVKFLRMILGQKDIDFTNKEIIGCFKNLASVVKRNFTKQRKQIEKFSSEQLNLIGDQETNIVELFKIINQKYWWEILMRNIDEKYWWEYWWN